MNAPALIAGFLLVAAVTAGTISDVVPQRQPMIQDGYHVLAADFHVHTFPLSAGTLAPWDMVLEARRQGLDAIAITDHDDVRPGKVGQWFSRLIGGPIVLVGEEIHAPHYHLIAVGIHTTISWRLSAAAAIDEVHRQHGVAIAAHPTAKFSRGFDAEAMQKLDGAEVLQPIAYANPNAAKEMQAFHGRRRITAIGSSDYHGLGPVGVCRTYVFTQENTEQGILDALRAGRTVVFDRGRAPEAAASQQGFLAALSRICGTLGLLGIILFGFAAPTARERER